MTEESLEGKPSSSTGRGGQDGSRERHVGLFRLHKPKLSPNITIKIKSLKLIACPCVSLCCIFYQLNKNQRK